MLIRAFLDHPFVFNLLLLCNGLLAVLSTPKLIWKVDSKLLVKLGLILALKMHT